MAATETTTTTTITVKLPKDVQRDLAALARRTGRTEVEVVLDAVERHLATESQPRPKAIGIYSDPDVTGENYEDWLAANWKPDLE